MNRARKIKVYIRTKGFFLPMPAIRFSTMRWLLKTARRFTPKRIEELDDDPQKYLDILSNDDIDRIFDELEVHEPFELVDLDVDDEEEGRVIVKVYTI